MKFVVGTIFLFFFVTNALTSEYVYEFGVDVGNVVYVKDGYISLFQHTTKVDIPAIDSTTITYIKVTVEAVTPPKVNYDSDTRKINITYSWSQISDSTYHILVKGITD